MTDKQRLIYDLALQCAAIHVQREQKNVYLEDEMLEAFTGSLMAFNSMDGSAFAAALEELKEPLKNNPI